MEFMSSTLRFLSRESTPISIPAGKASRLNFRNLLPQRLQVGVFQGQQRAVRLPLFVVARRTTDRNLLSGRSADQISSRQDRAPAQVPKPFFSSMFILLCPTDRNLVSGRSAFSQMSKLSSQSTSFQKEQAKSKENGSNLKREMADREMSRQTVCIAPSFGA